MNTPNTPKRTGRPPAKGPLTPLIEAVGGAANLASLVGVDYGTISRWNRGACAPSATARRLLAMIAAQHTLAAPFASKPGAP